MHGYRYIDGAGDLAGRSTALRGLRQLRRGLPAPDFLPRRRGLEISDRDLCMECGACARNCPVQALTVSPGVGCAVAILAAWGNRLLGRKVLSGCC